MKNRIVTAKNFVVRNERKILITTAVVTTTAAVVMRTGIKQHNDFLKENGLYDAFYAIGMQE